MDFDHTSNNGTADWSFPSPTATPTTGSFVHSLFQTPKTAAYSSHFNDAFSTPQLQAYQPPGQPDFSAFTPLQAQQRISERPQQQQQQQQRLLQGHLYGPTNNHAGGSVHPGLPIPPLVPSNASAQFPSSMLSPVYGQFPPAPAPAGTSMAFDTSQMQTPPPTRGAAVKKPTPSQLIAFGTPSTIASRRFVTPHQVPSSNHAVQASQLALMPFPQLQFSPDVHQLGNVGPASAPVFPQTQLLWEQTTSPTSYNELHVLDDPFAPMSSNLSGWLTGPAQQTISHALSFDTPAMSSFPVQPPLIRSASAAPVRLTEPRLSSPVMTTAGVDPSLVYNSPVPPIVPSNVRSEKARASHPKRRESSNNTDHQQMQKVFSAGPVAIPAPKGLRRSNTTGTIRSQQNLHPTLSTDNANRNCSVAHQPRTSSPLKRIGKLPLGPISETKKPNLARRSVILTIDENGRARTETRPAERGGSSSPARSIRDRYPGLFDSDSSEDESEEGEDHTPSRSTSFSFARGEERKSKAARLLDPPVEDLESLSIPPTSSSSSLSAAPKVAPSRAAIAAAVQLRRSGSGLRKQRSGHGHRRAAAVAASASVGASSSALTSIDTAPMVLQPDHRPRQPPPQQQASHSGDGEGEELDEVDWSTSTLDAHNRRWSLMSLEQQHPQPQPQQQQYSFHPQPGIASPPAPPPSNTMTTTTAEGQGPSIRCSCGIAHDRGQPLVQCVSCTQWSHASCADTHLQRQHLAPPAAVTRFTCFLCTKPRFGLKVGGVRRQQQQA